MFIGSQTALSFIMSETSATGGIVRQQTVLAGLVVSSLCVVGAAYHAGTSGEVWPLALATLGLGGLVTVTMDGCDGNTSF